MYFTSVNGGKSYYLKGVKHDSSGFMPELRMNNYGLWYILDVKPLEGNEKKKRDPVATHMYRVVEGLGLDAAMMWARISYAPYDTGEQDPSASFVMDEKQKRDATIAASQEKAMEARREELDFAEHIKATFDTTLSESQKLLLLCNL